MIPLSSRFAAPLLAALLVALLPVSIHFLGGLRTDECANPSALKEVQAIPGTRSVKERAYAEHEIAAVTQWTVGVARPPTSGISVLDFRILRSFDPKYLYLTPVMSLPLSQELSMYQPELRWIDGADGKLPVHVVRAYSVADARVVAYLFVYDSHPVSHPFRAQLASALPQLASGTRPMTLYSVSAHGPRRRVEEVEKAALDWMGLAWKHYRAACSG